MSTLTSLTFRLPTDLQKRASKKASLNGIPLAIILRNALDNFLREDKIVISTVAPDDATLSVPKNFRAQATTVLKNAARLAKKPNQRPI